MADESDDLKHRTTVELLHECYEYSRWLIAGMQTNDIKGQPDRDDGYESIYVGDTDD